MFKYHTYAAIILSISFSVHTNAIAGCISPSTQVKGKAALTTILAGNTVCTSDSQEQHRANSELWDYKEGNNSGDRTARVGTWSISGNKVSYSYGNSPNYRGNSAGHYALFDNHDDSYSFCIGKKEVAIAISIEPGAVGCPNFGN